jgi:hypothetical protein
MTNILTNIYDTARQTGVPHRQFVMVTEDVFRWFHRRWREIEIEWVGCPRAVVKAAHNALRQQVIDYISGGHMPAGDDAPPHSYMIPTFFPKIQKV